MSIAPIIFPDVELVLTGELRAALAAHGYPGIFVSNTRGNQATAVWVRRDGGPVLDQVREEARVGINVFAPDEKKVNDLARTVAALVRAMADGTPVVRVRQSMGPSPVPDASGPRRFMTFEITTRGVEL